MTFLAFSGYKIHTFLTGGEVHCSMPTDLNYSIFHSIVIQNVSQLIFVSMHTMNGLLFPVWLPAVIRFSQVT